MNAKNKKKSPIHENADANITYDFGDGDISRSRSRLPHSYIHTYIVSSIILRLSCLIVDLDPTSMPSLPGMGIEKGMVDTNKENKSMLYHFSFIACCQNICSTSIQFK